MEQMAPVLGYMEDMAEIVTKPDFVPEDDETLMEAFMEGLGTTVREAADVVPILEEVVPRVENIFEKESQNSMLGYATGGIVTGPEVPFTKEDPADRVDPFTGEPYQEQMDRLGFKDGKEVRDDLRADGTKKSQVGWKGPIVSNVTGKIHTELTLEDKYPLINPYTTEEQIEHLRNNNYEGNAKKLQETEIGREMLRNARRHYEESLEKGVSPFVTDDELQIKRLGLTR